MSWVGRHLKGHLVPLLQAGTIFTRSGYSSNLALNSSGNGAYKSSLGNLFKRFTTLQDQPVLAVVAPICKNCLWKSSHPIKADKEGEEAKAGSPQEHENDSKTEFATTQSQSLSELH